MDLAAIHNVYALDPAKERASAAAQGDDADAWHVGYMRRDGFVMGSSPDAPDAVRFVQKGRGVDLSLIEDFERVKRRWYRATGASGGR